MKSLILKATAMAFLLLNVSLSAQQKFGTIDLKKVFDGYWRTKSYSEQLRIEAAESSQELERRAAKLKAEFEEYRKSVQALTDSKLPKDQLERNQAKIVQRGDELRESEKELNTRTQQARELLSQRQDNAKANVMEDIRRTVSEKGKASGYDMVFDVSGGTSNGALLVIFHNGKYDLSDAVLAQLNANAPDQSAGGKIKPDAKIEPASAPKRPGSPVGKKP